MRLIYTLILLTGLSACSLPSMTLPKSLGEINSNYSYIPLDPLPVATRKGNSCAKKDAEFKDLLNALPDNAVRIAIGQYNKNGSLSFGPVQIGVENGNYQVILDYINVDTTRLPFEFYREETLAPNKRHSIYEKLTVENHIIANRIPLEEYAAADHKPSAYEVVIPVYVGVGLRLTANISVLKGNVSLSSLGALAAAAQDNRISGSMVLQTLGITGKQVLTTLPLPSELNPTTVQNAIMALGSIKSSLYDKESTITTARVTGIYNPIGVGGEALVNAIVSELAKSPIPWYRPCKYNDDKKS